MRGTRGKPYLWLAVVAVTVAAAGLSLGACRNSRQAAQAQLVAAEQTGAVPVYDTQRLTMATARPVDAYVLLGGRIKTCWFNASAPLLPRQVNRADVSPDGGNVKITIHDKKDTRGLAGKIAYAIDIAEEASGTAIITMNHSMTPPQAAKMQYDINRWKGGEANCSRAVPKSSA